MPKSRNCQILLTKFLLYTKEICLGRELLQEELSNLFVRLPRRNVELNSEASSDLCENFVLRVQLFRVRLTQHVRHAPVNGTDL